MHVVDAVSYLAPQKVINVPRVRSRQHLVRRECDRSCADPHGRHRVDHFHVGWRRRQRDQLKRCPLEAQMSRDIAPGALHKLRKYFQRHCTRCLKILHHFVKRGECVELITVPHSRNVIVLRGVVTRVPETEADGISMRRGAEQWATAV